MVSLNEFKCESYRKKHNKKERERERIRTLEKEDASNGENVTNNIKSGLVCEG
jgi:hypothetical protein